MNKTFNRVLSKNERLWRDAFVREVSSDPLDLKFFDELVEEKGGSAKVAFGIMYHAMSERLFRSRTHAFCVAVIGDASPRMMKFALEGATRELASGLPHLLFSRALDCVTLAPEGLMLTLCGNAVQSRESLLRFDAVLVASETRHGESQLLRLLKLLYRIPIVDLIMDTSMAPRNVRCIDFEVHTQSAASIYRLLTRDIPRCCDGLAVLQTHHFVPEKNKKVKRRVLAKMISRLYRERETAPTYLSEFASVFESLGFDQELGKNVDIEEHFWTVLNDKKRDLNMLNELLLGAGFKEAIFFESAVNELDIESYCTGVFFSRELAPALKRAMMQESFPQRWAPALREAKAFLAPSMFTQRHAVAEHVGFVEAAKHCIRRLERLEQGSAALANARFAAVECLIWVGSGDLGHSDWDEEIRIASASSRSDVRDAAAALKQKVLEWKRIEARAAQQENDEPEEDGELAREIATPPREDLSVAKSPAKETPLPAVRKRVSLFSWLLRLAFSGSLIFVLLKYRARVWQWLQAIIAKVKK